MLSYLYVSCYLSLIMIRGRADFTALTSKKGVPVLFKVASHQLAQNV